MVAEAIQADDPGSDLLRGVALLQLAAVHAAVAEGFALAEVLQIEGLPELPWFEAEVSWKARLVGDADAFGRYEQLVAEHQQRLARPVVPLDDDVEAWVAFLRVYGSHRAPFELLAELGMGLNDLARLSRQWRERFDTQAKLAKRAEKLAAKHELRWQRHAQLPPLPPIRVGEPQLVASALAGSYARSSPESHVGPAAAQPAPVLGLDRYAALAAELELADRERADRQPADRRPAGPSGRESVLARFELDEEAAADIDEAWRARLDSDEELAADFRILVAHYRNTAARRRRAAPVDAEPVARPAAPQAARPEAAQPPASPARPAPPQAAPWAPAPPSPPSTPPPSQVDATALTLPTLSSAAALPFSGSKVAPPPALVAPLPARTGDVDGTSAVIPTLLEAEVTPFDPRPRSQDLLIPRASRTQLSDEPAGRRGRFITLPFRGSIPFLPPVVADLPPPGGDVDGTSVLIPTLLDQPALPFGTAAEDEACEPEPPSDESIGDEPTKTRAPADPDTVRQQVTEPRRPPGELDTTHLIPLLVLEDEVAPAAASAEEAPDSVTLPTDPAPQLTLEQLASFHAEIAHSPGQAAAIRARYHLRDEPGQRRLEAHWWQRFAAHPDEHARYQQKLHEFQAWLRQHRR